MVGCSEVFVIPTLLVPGHLLEADTHESLTYIPKDRVPTKAMTLLHQEDSRVRNVDLFCTRTFVDSMSTLKILLTLYSLRYTLTFNHIILVKR